MSDRQSYLDSMLEGLALAMAAATMAEMPEEFIDRILQLNVDAVKQGAKA